MTHSVGRDKTTSTLSAEIKPPRILLHRDDKELQIERWASILEQYKNNFLANEETITDHEVHETSAIGEGAEPLADVNNCFEEAETPQYEVWLMFSHSCDSIHYLQNMCRWLHFYLLGVFPLSFADRCD